MGMIDPSSLAPCWWVGTRRTTASLHLSGPSKGTPGRLPKTTGRIGSLGHFIEVLHDRLATSSIDLNIDLY